MKMTPFSSWSRKRFVAVYAMCCAAIAGALTPLAYNLLLSPDEMRKWNPSYEETYWTPAQAQIAAERLASEISAYRLGETNLQSVRVRLAILQSKLAEMAADSDVGHMLAKVSNYRKMIDELDGFVQSTNAHLDAPSPASLSAVQSDIASLRPILVEFSANARSVETETKLDRDSAIQANRRLLMSAFGAVLLAAFVSVLIVLERLRARELELRTNLEVLAARQKALDEALRTEQARNTFLGKVSHEINSPLQSILTNVQLVEERYSGIPGLSKLTNRVKSGVSLLHVQVRDLLDVSEIKDGKLTLKLEPVDLKQAFEDVVAVQQSSAENKNLTLIFDHSGLVPVKTDGQRLAQILTNLVTNSIRNTDHGQIQVKANIGADDHKSRLVLSVTDTGVGIPPEVEARLFEPFVRANNSRRGSGLGLAIVKGIVDQLDGSISYTTVQGKGTTFVVTLPVTPVVGPRRHAASNSLAQGESSYRAPEATVREFPIEKSQLASASPEAAFRDREAAIQPAAATAQHAGAKLLFLEDDVSIQETLGDLLTDYGYEVHVVSTVLEANQSTMEEHYDCIILDMELPDGTGLDAANFARKTQNFKTPLLAVSAYHDLLSKPGTEVFSAALKKPVSIRDLRATVENCLMAA